MRHHAAFAIVVSLFLSACSLNAESVSKAQAKSDSALAYLPLLTVISTAKTADGYRASLKDENNTPFTAYVSKQRLGKSYTTLSAGDSVKIIGDYVDNDSVEINATRIVFIR